MNEIRKITVRYKKALLYELGLRDAQENLIDFAQLMMGKKGRLDDLSQSDYLVAPHHQYMADVFEDVVAGEILKVILNIPPRHGKSQLSTIYAAAWYSGNHPEKDIMVTTYSEKFARDFGLAVKNILISPRFKQIFPDYALRTKSSEHLTTNEGGNLYFLGRRSPTTGRGGHIIIVDDPTKDDRDTKFDGFREDLWQWFTQTLLTRRHNDKCAIIVTQTRWHEDDLVGRITDKTNPAFSAKFAEGFKYINIPAIAEEEDPLGRKVGEVLWKEKFGKKYLEEMEEANSVAFAALYQGNPTPDSGVFYQVDGIVEYDHHELPKNLVYYIASDHAVGTKQLNDPSCFTSFGICPDGIAWVLPTIVWRRINTLEAVDEMIRLIKEIGPVYWYAEKGHISKSIGPFLAKRMSEEQVYCPIIEDHPVGDKLQRAQSARARCAQGKIRFPKFAPWWPRAKTELLKFPNARFDDFVDTISTIGMKLSTHSNATKTTVQKEQTPGTFGYMLKQFKEDDHRKKAQQVRKGW